jgi:hypothetical protein
MRRVTQGPSRSAGTYLPINLSNMGSVSR